MKKILLVILTGLAIMTLQAQILNPVHFKTELKPGKGNTAEIVFTAAIESGWHVYSTELGNNGPIEATFNIKRMDGAETVGKLTPKGNVIKKYDKLFGMEVKYFEEKACFVQKIRFTKPTYDIDCFLEYGACNDENCLPPSEATFQISGESPITTPAEDEKQTEKPQVIEPVQLTSTSGTPPADTMRTTDEIHQFSESLWRPVVNELRAFGSGDNIADYSLFYILLMGFVGGLLAVCMPCIWPVIPMTVSFFLKRSKSDKQKGVKEAITYGMSIIVIYLTLGLLVTALFGSDTLNAMSTNAVFNIFLFVLLVIFALSFFGWFEIKLPDGWATAVDKKSDELSAKGTTGARMKPFYAYGSIFLMAFTLVLVSFSCTAPIIGLLLVETTTNGNWLAPALGMFGFALALSMPFTLFALFPSWLKQAPKSGAWMTTLKIVLGFIELAFSLKFLSVADLAYSWHLLDREVFLSLWIVIFGLLGAYLCGWLKFQEDMAGREPGKPMPVICIMCGLVSLAFAVYMVPGLWGAPCKAISAFAPPMNTQDFNLNSKVVEARFRDYEAGMAAARAEGKPVLIDFTGFGCVNCRKMEATVWTDPIVAEKLTKDFVLISLYVDDKTPLQQPIEITDHQGKKKMLQTVGAKWSYLQSHKFGANAQPFYVMLDGDGVPLGGSRAYDEDIKDYINFLNQGISRYKK